MPFLQKTHVFHVDEIDGKSDIAREDHESDTSSWIGKLPAGQEILISKGYSCQG